MNEIDEEYHKSIKRLQSKCYKSGFKDYIIKDCFKVIQNYNNIWTSASDVLLLEDVEKKSKTTQQKPITWSTSLKKILKLGKTESDLVPKAKMVYSRPSSLGSMITNYRKISHTPKYAIKATEHGDGNGLSKGCGRCGLCGNYGTLKNMVWKTDKIKRSDGVILRVKHQLSCKNSGIYAAQCLTCQEFYVGQTINSFNIRWNGHRKVWRNMMGKENEFNDEDKDEQALATHYAKNHNHLLGKSVKDLADAYKVVFLEGTRPERLDVAEGFWISKLRAEINISRSIVPKYI